MRVFALMLLVVLAFETLAPARGLAEPVAPGARIRLTGDWPGGGRRIGSFETYGRDSIWIRESLATPISARSITPREPAADSALVGLREIDVQRLEISTGVHRQGARSAAIGLLCGAIGGALIGAATYSDSDWLFTRGEEAAIAGITFGILGLGVGAIVGALTPAERWRTVPISELHASP